jgi:hypothetical protein
VRIAHNLNYLRFKEVNLHSKMIRNYLMPNYDLHEENEGDTLPYTADKSQGWTLVQNRKKKNLRPLNFKIPTTTVTQVGPVRSAVTP